MAKSKRTRRAKNKIEAAQPGALIKVEADPYVDAPQVVHRTHVVTVARPTIFTSQFEEVIDLIARERVYQAMLAGLGRRLLGPPRINGDGASHPGDSPLGQ